METLYEVGRGLDEGSHQGDWTSVVCKDGSSISTGGTQMSLGTKTSVRPIKRKSKEPEVTEGEKRISSQTRKTRNSQGERWDW